MSSSLPSKILAITPAGERRTISPLFVAESDFTGEMRKYIAYLDDDFVCKRESDIPSAQYKVLSSGEYLLTDIEDREKVYIDIIFKMFKENRFEQSADA